MLIVAETDAGHVVTLHDQVLGRIVKPEGQFFTWVPANPMPFGMKIATTVAFQLEMVVDHLKDVTERQYKSFETGEPPDEDTLHPELRPYLFDSTFGKTLKHPLHFDLMCNPQMYAQTNFIYKHRKNDAKDFRENKEWSRYVWLHERAFRIDAFIDIEKHLRDSAYWSMLASLWIDSENIAEKKDDWRTMLKSKRGQRHKIMSSGDRKKLAAMPDTLTIYRGVNYRQAVRGLSWTINRDKGLWFAQRHSSFDGATPILASATVQKDQVVAYLTGREEWEIIIFPENCNKITTE